MQNTRNDCRKIRKSSMKEKTLNCVYVTGILCTLAFMCISCVTINATNNPVNNKEKDIKQISTVRFPNNTQINYDDFTDDSNIVTAEAHNDTDYTILLDKKELESKFLANDKSDVNSCYKNLIELYTTVGTLTDEKDSEKLKEAVEPIIAKGEKCTASELNDTCQMIINDYVKQE